MKVAIVTVQVTCFRASGEPRAYSGYKFGRGPFLCTKHILFRGSGATRIRQLEESTRPFVPHYLRVTEQQIPAPQKMCLSANLASQAGWEEIWFGTNSVAGIDWRFMDSSRIMFRESALSRQAGRPCHRGAQQTSRAGDDRLRSILRTRFAPQLQAEPRRSSS